MRKNFVQNKRKRKVLAARIVEVRVTIRALVHVMLHAQVTVSLLVIVLAHGSRLKLDKQ